MPSFIVTQDNGADDVCRYLNTTPIPKTLEVVIKVFCRDRSKEQNALFHVWLAYIAKQFYLTHGMHYSPKVWKEYFKRELLGEESLHGPKGPMVRTRRTRDLSVRDMSEFMERMTVMCAEEWKIILRGGDEI